MRMRAILGTMVALLLMLAVVLGCQGQGTATKTEAGPAPKQTEQVPEKQAEPGSGTR